MRRRERGRRRREREREIEIKKIWTEKQKELEEDNYIRERKNGKEREIKKSENFISWKRDVIHIEGQLMQIVFHNLVYRYLCAKVNEMQWLGSGSTFLELWIRI